METQNTFLPPFLHKGYEVLQHNVPPGAGGRSGGWRIFDGTRYFRENTELCGSSGEQMQFRFYNISHVQCLLLEICNNKEISTLQGCTLMQLFIDLQQNITDRIIWLETMIST